MADINFNDVKITSEFTEAAERVNISSGETLGTIFGKIRKWFTDLHDCAFTGKAETLQTTQVDIMANTGFYPVVKAAGGDGCQTFSNVYFYKGQLMLDGARVLTSDDLLVSGTAVIKLTGSATAASQELPLPFTPTANTRIVATLRYAGAPSPSRYYVLSLCYISSKIYVVICNPQYTAGSSSSISAGTYYVDWVVLNKGE